jgi:hypothetical protein
MLSKTDLQSFAQCPLRLWLERHNPELISTDDTSLRRREMNGNLVGKPERWRCKNG